MGVIILMVLFFISYVLYQKSLGSSYQFWMKFPLYGVGVLLILKLLGIFVTILYYLLCCFFLAIVILFLINYFKKDDATRN